MDADARGERGALVRVESFQAALVIERERDSLDRAIEHDQEAVGLVDLATAMRPQQGARETVVLAEEFGRTLVAEPLYQRGRIDEIAQHERAQQRHRSRLRNRRGRLGKCTHTFNTHLRV